MSTKVTSGTGFQQQLVKIVELLPNTSPAQARCQNPKTSEEYYASLTQRHYTAWPQIGEYWIITRNVGPWDLTIKITDAAPPTVTGTVTTGTSTDSLLSALASIGLITNQTTEKAPEAWQTPSPYAAHWADATTFGTLGGGHGLRFTRVDGGNTLWLYGLVAASTSAATTIFTLPANYFNTNYTGFGTFTKINGSTLTTAAVAISTAGAVIVEGTPANGDVFLINMRTPLGTLP